MCFDTIDYATERASVL